ncbi:CotO family spore coat protein [Bacillus sp. CGMCC 1.16607]|uniref:CotO family spore coat protein n=1 Tax=Bacillus sp. CGMCC 1.16607 TaxID=3351842 RepID=UPI00362BF44C
MAIEKNQRPLLYIEQPNFDKLVVPMQQYFISRKPFTKKIEEQEQSELNNMMVEEPKDELTDPNVMEFMLEGILSSKEETKDSNENMDYLPTFDNIIDTTIELKKKRKGRSVEDETEEEEESEGSHKQSNSKEKNEKKKSRKRTPFNNLSLTEKLNELRKMPRIRVKVLYEIVTKDKNYSGYFISFKNDGVIIQPKNSDKTVKIPEQQIIDVRITGF